MGEVISLHGNQGETRELLLLVFTDAASALYEIDLPKLAKEAKDTSGWDSPDKPSFATPTGRASLVLKQAEPIAATIAHAFPSLSKDDVVLEVSGKLEPVITELYDDMKGGVSMLVLRREWSRSINMMVDTLTDSLWGRIHASRSAAPNPRSV